jgi:hypothetical protein
MRTVTKGLVVGVLALAKRNSLGLGDLHRHGCEICTSVGAVTEGLILRATTSAPVVGSRLELDYGRDFLGDYGIRHGFFGLL